MGNVHLSLIEHMNHVLKEEAALAFPQASYTDPERPLAPGLLDAVLAGLAR